MPTLNILRLTTRIRIRKSQIAIEYCYRFKDRHSASSVFWIGAGTRAEFTKGYEEIADSIKIPGRNDAGVDILQLVCTWLRRHQRDKWLLVIDNADYSAFFSGGPKEELAVELGTVYDSASPISKFIPETRNGFVLITSRSKTIARRLTGDITTVLTVEPMPLDEARTLLHIHLAADGNIKDVDQLLQPLSRIPLALKQAAAYINRHAPRMTVKKYLLELLIGGSAQAELLYQGFSDVRKDPNSAKSIGQTWQLVLYHIRDMAPSSIHFLSLASLFDPDGIHKDLLMHYEDEQTANLGYQRKREGGFDKDISILKSYSFIMTNEHGDSFVMHRLVQSWLKVWLQRVGELEKWKVKFLSILSTAFPGNPYKNRAKCKSLFPHAVLAIDYRPAEVKHLELYATVLERVSSYARAIGNYELAETMSEASSMASVPTRTSPPSKVFEPRPLPRLSRLRIAQSIDKDSLRPFTLNQPSSSQFSLPYSEPPASPPPLQSRRFDTVEPVNVRSELNVPSPSRSEGAWECREGEDILMEGQVEQCLSRSSRSQDADNMSPCDFRIFELGKDGYSVPSRRIAIRSYENEEQCISLC